MQKSLSCYAVIDFDLKRIYHADGYYHDDIQNAMNSDDYILIDIPTDALMPALKQLINYDLK